MTQVLIVLAVVLTGLSAGLFATFSYAVMPGLRRCDDASFVQAMRGINIAILSPVFAVVFVGAALVTVAALVAGWGSDARPWMIAALALYVLGAFAVTGAVNVPLNDALEAGIDDVSRLRTSFEPRWVVWNHARSLTTTGALVCLAVGAVRL